MHDSRVTRTVLEIHYASRFASRLGHETTIPLSTRRQAKHKRCLPALPPSLHTVGSQNTASSHMAYFCVHSRASELYFSRSVLYIRAISGTSGSSGFGSHSNEQMLSSTEKKQEKVSDSDFIALTIESRTSLLKLSALVTTGSEECRDRCSRSS